MGLQLSRLELGLGQLLSEIVELTLKTRNLGIARRDGLISRLDDVCRPPLEVLVLTALRVHVQRPGGILSDRGHKTPAALGSAAAVEASAACSDSAEAVLRWAQRSAASCAAA